MNFLNSRRIISNLLNNFAKQSQNDTAYHKFFSTTKRNVEHGNVHVNDHTIADYYKNCNLFITGGMGFIGKVLVEKLLRSCGSLNNIYLLARPKKGLTMNARLNETFNSAVFDNIKEENPSLLEKVKLIEGDMFSENLGIAETDRIFLKENTNIVIHSAATLKFNEHLKVALKLNTLGTKNILELFKDAPLLKKFIYISTGYAHCHKIIVKEKLYDSTCDPVSIINFIQNCPDSTVSAISTNLVNPHLNTYCYSKALAERIVGNFAKDMPAVVFRPTIVTASWKEVIPGWADNLNGALFVNSEIGSGLIRGFPFKKNVTFDLMPVDVLVNAIITSAWHSTIYPTTECPVYNCGSGNINKLSVKTFIDYTLKYNLKYPTSRLCWYPRHGYNIGKIKEQILRNIFQRPIAIFADILLVLKGNKPRYFSFNNKIEEVADCTGFIPRTDIKFETKNLEKMLKDMKTCKDYETFNFDMSSQNGFSWEKYLHDLTIGLRKHVFKEDVVKDCEKNKVLLNRYFWCDIGLKSACVFSFVGVLNLIQ